MKPTKVHELRSEGQTTSRSQKWERTVNAIAERDGGFDCKLCNKPIKIYEEVSIDHVIPRSKKGSSSIKNLQLAHRRCNSIKSDKEEYTILSFPKPKASKAKYRKSHVNHISLIRDKGVIQLSPSDSDTNWIAELWNEISKNGTANLSYAILEEYFEKYASLKVSTLDLIPRPKSQDA